MQKNLKGMNPTWHKNLYGDLRSPGLGPPSSIKSSFKVVTSPSPYSPSRKRLSSLIGNPGKKWWEHEIPRKQTNMMHL